tara:strand:+ start:764 stop:1456 length:693 start_codon:yes stop_codon:yes gene_type:complete
MNKKSISIIVPVLNEEKIIESFIENLLVKSFYKNDIIVVDGGSRDSTTNILKKFSELRIFKSKKGRATQMNYGALKAKNEILYFLHCDSIPPKNFDQIIFNQYTEGKEMGCFRMLFKGSHIFLKFSSFFTRFNYKICRGGDQSLYISKNLFKSLKGFNEKYTYCEDMEFIDRLYSYGKFNVIQQDIITSNRRFIENGTIKLQFHFGVIHTLRLFGYSAFKIKSYYEKYVK